ncbi:MAG TPA: hypothetical protein VHC72_02160 [Bryobacteraceae bacterium]|nr:hypothetical protein [Bryobacteraceae bacterium]
MLKITTTAGEDGTLTIGISGRLTAAGCDSIDQMWKDARDRRQEVAIDLKRVTLLDRASVEYLARIRSRGVALVNVPSYVSRWIESSSD